MSKLKQFKFFLWYFGFFKIALIGYLRPRLIELDEQHIVVRLPLKRRSKNHLGSMYVGALVVGADIASGLHGFYFADKEQCRVSLIFKSLQGQFYKRPEQDVYFVNQMGKDILDMIQQSKKSGARINKPIIVKAFTNYPDAKEAVAEFTFELSIKVASKKQ